jgi:hypothetical protein
LPGKEEELPRVDAVEAKVPVHVPVAHQVVVHVAGVKEAITAKEVDVHQVVPAPQVTVAGPVAAPDAVVVPVAVAIQAEVIQVAAGAVLAPCRKKR